MTTDEELKELFIKMEKYPITQKSGLLLIKIIMTYYKTHKINYMTLQDDWKKTGEILNKVANKEVDFDVFIKEMPQQTKEFYSECITAFLGIIEENKKNERNSKKIVKTNEKDFKKALKNLVKRGNVTSFIDEEGKKYYTYSNKRADCPFCQYPMDIKDNFECYNCHKKYRKI